jgi:flagellar biosynthesis/type III secretory pathway protein FliH
MKYFATKDADSRETETINDQVSYYKADTLIRNKYMTYEFDLHESKEEGRAEGRAEGKAEEAAKALKEKKAMAKGFRDAKVPLKTISAQTGFTTDEIKAL